MGPLLRTRFLLALQTATATLGDVAQGMGRGYRTLQAYSRGERRVTPRAARAMAAYLRGRAQAFSRAADGLEAAADAVEKAEKTTGE